MARHTSEMLCETEMSGQKVPVCRALRLLLCHFCGGLIRREELFSRWSLTGHADLKLLPKCERCAPIPIAAPKTSLTSTAPLVREILSTPGNAEMLVSSVEAQQKAHERLAPALNRRRRLPQNK